MALLIILPSSEGNSPNGMPSHIHSFTLSQHYLDAWMIMKHAYLLLYQPSSIIKLSLLLLVRVVNYRYFCWWFLSHSLTKMWEYHRVIYIFNERRNSGSDGLCAFFLCLYTCVSVMWRTVFDECGREEGALGASHKGFLCWDAFE